MPTLQNSFPARCAFAILLALSIGCDRQPAEPSKPPATSPGGSALVLHPRLDIEHWIKTFPLPSDWQTEVHGPLADCPEGIAAIEQVRRRAQQLVNLGQAVPVDIFAWSLGPPPEPYLTKMGGVPHRERSKPWPKGRNGKSLSFVAQLCFVDSRDLCPRGLPGDVLLIYYATRDGPFGRPDDMAIEWSPLALREPMNAADCPAQLFALPEMAGVIHRTHEYPDGQEAFDKIFPSAHSSYLFLTTQSTKIGSETWFIQNDPRQRGERLLCTFNCFGVGGRWPFTNRKFLPGCSTSEGDDVSKAAENYALPLGDSGCIYFLIDPQGKVRFEYDCY